MLRELFRLFYSASTKSVASTPHYRPDEEIFPKEREDWARRLVDVLVKYNYFSNCTLDYLTDRELTYKKIAARYRMNFNTVRSSIWYYLRKFDKDIGKDELRHILRGGGEYLRLKEYVIHFEGNQDSRAIIDGLSCGIPNVTPMSNVTQEKITHMLLEIQKCTKLYAQRIMSGLTTEQLGYLKYILEYNDILNNRDNANLNVLRDMTLLGITYGTDEKGKLVVKNNKVAKEAD